MDNDVIDCMYGFRKDIREMALEMAVASGKKGAHIGGSFSCIEIFSVLYGGIMRYDIQDPTWPNRDRFIASKAHCILAHFPALAKAGFIDRDELFSFCENNGTLAGHPWNIKIGLEFPGGSLGMGLAVGIGMALTARAKKLDYKTYVLLGDGECNEGSVWEAFMAAVQYKLDSLIAIIDYNNMQFDGINDNIMSIAPLKDKLLAFGWEVIEVDGHCIEELYAAMQKEHTGKPLVIIAKTIKAFGIPSLENKPESHHSLLKKEDYDYVKKEMECGRYDRIQ